MTLVFDASAGFTNSNMEIIYAGSLCKNIDATNNAAITCDLPTNTDSTPMLEAGA